MVEEQRGVKTEQNGKWWVNLLKALPKPLIIIIGSGLAAGIVILAVGSVLVEYHTGHSELLEFAMANNTKADKIRDNAIKQMMEMKERDIAKDPDKTPQQKKADIAEVKQIRNMLVGLNQQTTEQNKKMKFGYFDKDLSWHKDKLGKYSQIYVIYTDWHLTNDVPYDNPKDFKERILTFYFLLGKVGLEEFDNKQIRKNIDLMNELNNENVRLNNQDEVTQK